MGSVSYQQAKAATAVNSVSLMSNNKSAKLHNTCDLPKVWVLVVFDLLCKCFPFRLGSFLVVLETLPTQTNDHLQFRVWDARRPNTNQAPPPEWHSAYFRDEVGVLLPWILLADCFFPATIWLSQQRRLRFHQAISASEPSRRRHHLHPRRKNRGQRSRDTQHTIT